MLRITIQLIPLGDESRASTLATMEIANDATGTVDVGNYTGTLHAEYTRSDGRKGRITNFNRRKQSVWSLVGAFLKLWGHTAHSPKDRIYMKKKMSKKDRAEFEALPNKAEKAKWMLAKGITAMPTVNPETLDFAHIAMCAGACVGGYHPTEQEAITAATQMLERMAAEVNSGINPTPIPAGSH